MREKIGKNPSQTQKEIFSVFYMVTTNVPNPREISNEIHDQAVTEERNPFGVSAWMWAFGVFIDHNMGVQNSKKNRLKTCRRTKKIDR